MIKTVLPSVHLLIDFWTDENLKDPIFIEKILRQAAAVAGANVLNVMLHKFGDEGGVTGVALLAESHMSIHTWPEIDFIALDVFMCGECNAYAALDVFRAEFKPEKECVRDFKRGA